MGACSAITLAESDISEDTFGRVKFCVQLENLDDLRKSIGGSVLCDHHVVLDAC